MKRILEFPSVLTQEQHTMEQTTNQRIKEMTAVVDRLHALLHDPHPGLATWCLMFAQAIIDFHALTGTKQ